MRSVHLKLKTRQLLTTPNSEALVSLLPANNKPIRRLFVSILVNRCKPALYDPLLCDLDPLLGVCNLMCCVVF
jgi:hypothetical protein